MLGKQVFASEGVEVGTLGTGAFEDCQQSEDSHLRTEGPRGRPPKSAAGSATVHPRSRQPTLTVLLTLIFISPYLNYHSCSTHLKIDDLSPRIDSLMREANTQID